MKDYAKVGGRKGKPAYRTPSFFKYKASLGPKILAKDFLKRKKSSS